MTLNVNKAAVGTLLKDVTTTKGATLESVEDFHKDIVGDKYAAIINGILNAKTTAAMKKIVDKGKEVTVPLAEHLKKLLPLYVPQADVRKRRMWEHATAFTGLAPIDCDHLTREQIDALMAWSERQPWIVEGHRSCSGKGVHLIVAMGVVESDSKDEYAREYKRRYAIISSHIEQQTGIAVDGQCKDVLRGIFVSHDPKAFLRPMSEVACFDYPEKALPGDTPEEVRKHTWHAQEAQVSGSGGIGETASEAKKSDTVTGGPACQAITKRMLSAFLRYHIYKPSARHSWWISLGQYLKYKKVRRDDLPLCRESARGLLMYNNLIQSDDPLLRSANEVDEAMAWGYDHSDETEKDNSTPKRKRGRPRKSDAEKGEKKMVTMEQIHQTLDSMAEFRRNIISEQVEMKWKKGKGTWREMNDPIFDTLYVRVKMAGIKTNTTDVRAAIESLDYAPEYDPVTDYLDNCPAWDPSQPDYITKLFRYLLFSERTEEAYALPKLKNWFVCMVALWLGKVDTNQTMPVLYGVQNAGKSHFYRHLLPPELRQYYKETHPGDSLDKDQRIAMSRNLLIAFEEFSFSERNTSNQIKAYVSSVASAERAAYGRFQIVRRRLASLIASTNDDIIIRDRLGSRRYLCVSVRGTEHIGNNTLPYAGAYAQARWIAENNDPSTYIPSKDEANDITEHNEQYVERSQCEMILPLYFRKPEDYETGEMLTLGEIASTLMPSIRNVSHVAIGKALKKNGILPIHYHNGQRYYLVRVQNQDREQEAKRLGQEEYNRKHKISASEDEIEDGAPF